MAYFYSMDIVKFICVVFVVVVHVSISIPANDIDTFVNYYSYRYLLDIAVPFFYAASGFFLAGKSKDYIVGYSSKILYYYVIFSIFYMGINFFFLITDRVFLKEPFWPGLEAVTERWTFVNILNGTIGSFHLWFLVGLLFSSLFLALLYYRKPITILVISLTLSMFLRAEVFDFGYLFEYGGLPRGILYLALGYYIGKTDLTAKGPLLWSAFYMFLYYVSNHYFNSGINELLLYLCTFYLIIYCKDNPGKKNRLSLLGRYTLGVYILHFATLEVFRKTLKYTGIEYYNDWYYYIIATIISVVIPLLTFNFIYRALDSVVMIPYRHITSASSSATKK